MNNIADIEKLLHSLRQEVPSETFRTNARIRILNTITHPKQTYAHWYQNPRMLRLSFGSALATIVLSVSTVFASQSSVPTNPLFPVKVLSERAALTLSPTESMKTTVAATIISRRISEVEELQKGENTQAIEASISRFNEDVTSIQKRKDISQDEIEETLKEHEEEIRAINRHNEEDDEKKNENVNGAEDRRHPD